MSVLEWSYAILNCRGQLGVRPFKLLCLNSDPQCDTASQLKIEMLDESWMGDTFLESFMVSQVRMATPAPGSWQERDSRQERAGGKEWSPFLLWEPWDFGGEARREPVLSALLLLFYRWTQAWAMLIEHAWGMSTGSLSLLIGSYILNSVLHDNLVNVKTYQDWISTNDSFLCRIWQAVSHQSLFLTHLRTGGGDAPLKYRTLRNKLVTNLCPRNNCTLTNLCPAYKCI